jgi:hypothetical protein
MLPVLFATDLIKESFEFCVFVLVSSHCSHIATECTGQFKADQAIFISIFLPI